MVNFFFYYARNGSVSLPGLLSFSAFVYAGIGDGCLSLLCELRAVVYFGTVKKRFEGDSLLNSDKGCSFSWNYFGDYNPLSTGRFSLVILSGTTSTNLTGSMFSSSAPRSSDCVLGIPCPTSRYRAKVTFRLSSLIALKCGFSKALTSLS